MLFALAFFAGQAIGTDTITRFMLRVSVVALIGIGLYSVLELAGVAPADLATKSARLGGWEDLGVDPPTTEFGELFVATDGSAYEPVSSPFGKGEVLNLIAVADGFHGMERIYADSHAESRLWRSPDGRDWTRLSTPAEADWIETIGEIDGTVVAVAATSAGEGKQSVAVFASENQGTNWTSIDLQSLVDGSQDPVWLVTADVAANRVVVAFGAGATDGNDPRFHVVMSEDLTTWSEFPLLAEGAGGNVYVEWAAGGPGQALVSILDLDSATEHLTLVGTPR